MPTHPCPSPRREPARGRVRERAARAGFAATRVDRRAAGIALLTLLGCARAEAPAVVAPSADAPGVVLWVDDLPLRAAELEPLCADIVALYPEYTRQHARRLALTNEFLPRLATRASAPEAWARARAECEAWDPARTEALEPMRLEGGFKGLGLALWSAARHLREGVWSGPLELTGRWLRLRLDGKDAASDPLRESLQLALFEFPYIDPRAVEATVQAAIEHARLRLVDTDYATAVPEAWKHRMRGPAR